MAHVFEQQTKGALLVARVILVARKMSNISKMWLRRARASDRLASLRKPQFVNCVTLFCMRVSTRTLKTYIDRSTSETISRLTEAQNSASVSVYRDPEPRVLDRQNM